MNMKSEESGYFSVVTISSEVELFIIYGETMGQTKLKWLQIGERKNCLKLISGQYNDREWIRPMGFRHDSLYITRETTKMPQLEQMANKLDVDKTDRR